jgi:hypothetical protein
MSIFKDLLNNARSDEPEKEPEISSKNDEKRGKRSHPDYRQTTVYVRKDVHRKLMRILEDSGYKGDFSDWIEERMLSEINQQEKE